MQKDVRCNCGKLLAKMDLDEGSIEYKRGDHFLKVKGGDWLVELWCPEPRCGLVKYVGSKALEGAQERCRLLSY